MSSKTVLAKKLVLGAALLLGLTLGWRVCADSQPGQAEVRAVRGSATVSTNGEPAHALQAGAVLYSKAVIKTGTNSSVDLFLGRSAGNVRITANTTFALDKLGINETGADTAVEVQLNLQEGEMYFDVNKLSKASRYEIKMPTGVAGIRGTRGRLCVRPGSKQPPVVLLEGKLYFVEVSGDGAKTTGHILSAPPAVYFNEADSTIKPATPQVVREVEQELGEAKKQIGKKPDQAQGQEKGQGKEKGKSQPDSLPKQANTSEPFLSPGSGVRAREKPHPEHP